MRRLLPAALPGAFVVLSAAGLLRTAAAQSVSTVPTSPVQVEPKYVGWPSYGRDPTHQAISPFKTQTMNRILWQTPVDLAPQYSGTSLLIHYGSPLITPGGTLIVTVKTGATGGFRVEGRNPDTGALLWQQTNGWIAPSHTNSWYPSCSPCVTPWNEVAMPGPGGTLILRGKPDAPNGPVRQIAFFGTATYQANPAAFNSTVFINTPVTCDSVGNLFFGYLVTGTPPITISSGIARISAAGVGTFVSAATAAGTGTITIRKPATNCAPALSRDESSLYIGVNTASGLGSGSGYLLKLDSTTLVRQARVQLHDVRTPLNNAIIDDAGTASPMVGPDGDVYYGVLANTTGSNNSRGWMLHFDGSLATTKIPGAFGWDDTPSVVPASAVPSYAGTSSYLLLTKYNNYGGTATGTGLNKVAILDPFQSFTEPVSGATTMREVITILGQTPDPNFPGGVREWCINSAAVDVGRRSAIVNSEDGKCYRWDFATNSLVEPVTLTAGVGEAYTMTIVGPRGVCFAINNAILFALGT